MTKAKLASFVSLDPVEVSGRARVVVGIDGMAKHVLGVKET